MESVLGRCEERVRSVADVEVEAYLVGDQSSLARSAPNLLLPAIPLPGIHAWYDGREYTADIPHFCRLSNTRRLQSQSLPLCPSCHPSTEQNGNTSPPTRPHSPLSSPERRIRRHLHLTTRRSLLCSTWVCVLESQFRRATKHTRHSGRPAFHSPALLPLGHKQSQPRRYNPARGR